MSSDDVRCDEPSGEQSARDDVSGEDVVAEARVGTRWRDLWVETTAAVGDRAEARWLCETASSAYGQEFLDVLAEVPTTRMVQHLDAMVARYRTGEPLQYVLGRWAFRRLDLAIDRRVLIPRAETEEVAEVAIERARRSAPRMVIDLGTGSGAIGLSLARELPLVGTTVWMTDIDPDAVSVARANLAGIGRAAANVRLVAGSWFGSVPADVRFDVVVSNPPYVAEDSADLDERVAAWEPARALFAGADGLDCIREIVDVSPGRLSEDGWLVLEIGSDHGDAVRGELTRHGYRRVQILPDVSGRDRIAVAQSPA